MEYNYYKLYSATCNDNILLLHYNYHRYFVIIQFLLHISIELIKGDLGFSVLTLEVLCCVPCHLLFFNHFNKLWHSSNLFTNKLAGGSFTDNK